jgi:hypothetical protein
VKCASGCTCNRHRKCELDCTCGRHSKSQRKENVKYSALHYRVRIDRGNAKDHTCIDCGEQAAEWSTIRDTDGTDNSHYEPRCVKCHRAYDNQDRIWVGHLHTPETIEKMRESHRNLPPRPEEWKQNNAAANRGQKRSPEVRARMSASQKARFAREKAESSGTYSNDPEDREKRRQARIASWETRKNNG